MQSDRVQAHHSTLEAVGRKRCAGGRRARLERNVLGPEAEAGGRVGVGEVERQQRVGRQMFERARTLRGADEVDLEALGRGDEGLGAVGAGRQEQEQPGQGRYDLPGV